MTEAGRTNDETLSIPSTLPPTTKHIVERALKRKRRVCRPNAVSVGVRRALTRLLSDFLDDRDDRKFISRFGHKAWRSFGCANLLLHFFVSVMYRYRASAVRNYAYRGTASSRLYRNEDCRTTVADMEANFERLRCLCTYLI
jgi:hypothetical protein